MDILLSILDATWKVIFIVFFFGFCIFIHEFGHMLAALWQGLHVERFSIGMGPVMWKIFTWRNVDFVLSWIPFGGYVALPQLDATDSPKTMQDKKLEPCKPWPRAVVAFAGPFFNILFGFVLAFIMWGVGLWENPKASSCIISSVPQSLPDYEKELSITDRLVAFDGEPTDLFADEICAKLEPGTTHSVTVKRGDKDVTFDMTTLANPEWEAGLRAGDRIVGVNGKHFTKGYEEFSMEYVFSGAYKVTVNAIRDGKPFDATYIPLRNPLMEGLGAPFFTATSPVALGGVHPNSPAAMAGLQAGDQLLQLNDTNIMGGKEFLELLAKMDGAPFSLLVTRNGKDMLLEGIRCPAPYTLHNFGAFFAVSVSSVVPDLPAKKAGIRRGDRILSVDGVEVLDSKQITEYIRSTEGKPMTINLVRNGKPLELKGICSEKVEMEGGAVYLLGVTLSNSAPKVIGHPNPWAQFTRIVSQTWRTLSLLFSPITSRVTGRERGQATVKVEHMSGALGILTMMWYTLSSEGLRGGFSLIILITFSLAIMNLLPIPALDGCYILFSIIEILIRRRLPYKLVNALVSIFFYLLLALIVYITFFDGRRIFRLLKFGSIKGVPPKVEKVTPDAPPAAQEKQNEQPVETKEEK